MMVIEPCRFCHSPNISSGHNRSGVPWLACLSCGVMMLELDDVLNTPEGRVNALNKLLARWNYKDESVRANAFDNGYRPGETIRFNSHKHPGSRDHRRLLKQTHRRPEE